LPPILIINLKRYQYNIETESFEKIKDKYAFPKSLDLS